MIHCYRCGSILVTCDGPIPSHGGAVSDGPTGLYYRCTLRHDDGRTLPPDTAGVFYCRVSLGFLEMAAARHRLRDQDWVSQVARSALTLADTDGWDIGGCARGSDGTFRVECVAPDVSAMADAAEHWPESPESSPDEREGRTGRVYPGDYPDRPDW